MTTLRSLKPPASNLPGDLIQEILSLVSCVWLVPYGQKRVVIRKDLMASLHQSPHRVSAQKHFTGNPSRKTNCLKDKNQDTSSSNTTIFCFCWLQRGHLDFVQFLCLATITKRGGKPSMIAHTCSLSICGMEGGKSEIQGHAWLYSECKSLDYVSPCLKENKKQAAFKEVKDSW